MMSANTRFSKRHILISLFLVAATVAAFWQVTHSDFVSYDDYLYVTENSHVNTGLTADNVTWAVTKSRASNWHPLTWISHMLDVTLYGLNPMGHHVTSLLFHLANIVILFLVLSRMTGGAATPARGSGPVGPQVWKSAFVAAVFALHPLHVESVAWVAERKDVLSTFFWCLTMFAYIRYVERPSPARYVPVFVLFGLGLMSKPMLVTLPIVLLLLDYWPLARMSGIGSPRSWPRLVLEKLPLFVLSAASCIVTYLVQQSGGSIGGADSYPFGVRSANACVSAMRYIGKTFYPRNLAVFYPHPGDTLSVWLVLGSVLLLAGLTAIAVRLARTRPYVTVGWFWYLITLVPVIGLVQVGRQAMADRYTYVPLVGLFVIFAWGVPDLLERKDRKKTDPGRRRKLPPKPENASAVALSLPLGLAAVAIVLTLACLTYGQVGTWRNSETLFSHAVDVTTGNYVAHTNLAEILVSQNKLNEAYEHLNAALSIQPNSSEANNNMGLLMMKRNDAQGALDHYKKALIFKPESPEISFNMGTALVKLGRLDEGIDCYKKALELRPDYADAHASLGLALSAKGRFDDAMAQFDEAIRIAPRFSEAYNNRGILLLNHGKLDEAMRSFTTANEIKPDDAATHNNLAAVDYYSGNYANAWTEIHLCRRYGLDPSPALIGLLSRKMHDPDN